jgi:chromate reductase
LRPVQALSPENVEATLYEGMMELPHFNPDADREGMAVAPEVAALREQLHRCDAVVICTPEYAGAMPGALKNLLEWTVGDASTYRKPVAWINVSGPAAPTGGADAHESLRKVLAYVDARVIERACLRLPLTRDAVGADGQLHQPEHRRQLQTMLATLLGELPGGNEDL